MIELYQELVPFTNEKTTYKASTNDAFTNPILMPLSFDVTSSYNTVETVLYIRNNNKDKFYTNVHVCLLAPIAYSNTPTNFTPDTVLVSFAVSGAKTLFKQGSTTKYEVDTEYGIDTYPANFNLYMPTIDSTIGQTLVPFSGISSPNYTISQVNSEVLDARFSLGYDEVSEKGWLTKSHSVIIPSIGNSTMPDNSYYPVRMRLTLNNNYGDMLTLRNFSVHIAYASEGNVV